MLLFKLDVGRRDNGMTDKIQLQNNNLQQVTDLRRTYTTFSYLEGVVQSTIQTIAFLKRIIFGVIEQNK